MGYDNQQVNNLLTVKNNDSLFANITKLQNEVGVSFNTKVIVISSVNNDLLAAAFAKGYADTFERNGDSVLIIDANLYSPVINEIVGSSDVEINDPSEKENFKITFVSEKVNAICMKKDIYPSNIYKAGTIHKLINDNKDKYDHIIILVPSIKEHKEVSLLSDIVESIILVTQKNVTKKGDIYNCCSFFYKEKLPLSKVVVVK